MHTRIGFDPGWAQLNPLLQTKTMTIRPYVIKSNKKVPRQSFQGRGNSKTDNSDLDRGLYRYRHLVENIFVWLKQS
ncbi:hypothetical protein Neut_1600 [Nitrosomonas eutropha C91]|uniref:Transposase IS4-like domain-containing protein n=1 Tax=Nitrosomonas eutropha (strain DSM 101675 / C91 / Nm57) TaxID=335283 RepID=Q0AFN9_NITEC|nr:hypothetical protein Neut_1600 [Nitrosomonas eutropha C91]